MWELLLVFIATIAADWIWAAYIIHTSKKHAMTASILSVLIVCISSFVTLVYIQDHRAIIAMAAGAFIGTYLSIRFSKNDQSTKSS